MSRVILLDAGPLGLVTNPKLSPVGAACSDWLQELVGRGTRILLPEIANYEVRRELLRADKLSGIERLDALGKLLEYLPLTTAAIRQAARFWAQARQQGQPTGLTGRRHPAGSGLPPTGLRLVFTHYGYLLGR